MFKVFWLKICLQVLASESSALLKLIQKCKILVVKNGVSLVDANLLLSAQN